MFTDEFLDTLSENPYEALEMMCNEYKLWVGQDIQRRKGVQEYDAIVEAYAVVEAFVEAHGLPFDPAVLDTDRGTNVERIRTFFVDTNNGLVARKTACHIDTTRAKYRNRFNVGFWYEFSDGDLKRIQELINELRDAITASDLFEEKHKQRILKKLEKLQAELHKKMGSLAQIYELVGDFGVLLGKFGEDAKPFVDRIREIVQIGWRAEARAEELPSGLQFPQLPDGKGKEDKE